MPLKASCCPNEKHNINKCGPVQNSMRETALSTQNPTQIGINHQLLPVTANTYPQPSNNFMNSMVDETLKHQYAQ